MQFKTRIRTRDVQNKCEDIYIYYANIYKHEHEKKMRRLWCKIVPKTSVEQIKRNEGSYLYAFGDLT
jgi:hypothetical protein